MRKLLLTSLLIIVMVASLFVLTACGNKEEGGETPKGAAKIKTTEVSTEYGRYNIKFTVPVKTDEEGNEVPAYEFVEEVPEAVENIAGESTFLVGEKVVVGIESNIYTYQTGVDYKKEHGEIEPSFDSFKEFVFSEKSSSTLKKGEIVQIGDREAIKADVRIGSGSGDLYGYKYVVNVDDITPKSYMTVSYYVPDGNFESTEATFADAEVQTIINSLIVEAAAEE